MDTSSADPREAGSGDTLTFEKLKAQVDALGEMPSRMKIIVGFPLVATDRIAQHVATNTFLVGKSAWSNASRQFAPSPVNPSALLGVAVEYYDPDYEPHRALLLKRRNEMGDHRISWAIKAQFHGIEREYGTPDNMTWLNFSPADECEELDQRVVRFFRELYCDGMAVYYDEIAEHQAEMYAAEIERAERIQLAKLKAKYDPPSTPPSGDPET